MGVHIQEVGVLYNSIDRMKVGLVSQIVDICFAHYSKFFDNAHIIYF